MKNQVDLVGRVEVIIPVRDERQGDVLRTLRSLPAGVPVAVVWDGQEPCALPIERPIRHLRNAAPMGPAASRHRAIETSTAEIVVLLDAHMEMTAKTLPAIVAALDRDPRAVTCCRTRALDADWKPLPEPVQQAAVLASGSREMRNGEIWRLPVCSIWERPQVVRRGNVRVCAIMGACYGMRRDTYWHIGGPLRLFRTWGGDEEALSLGAAIMGGHCVLLDQVASHVYKQHGRHVRKPTDAEIALQWQGQLALVECLPCAEAERNILRQMLLRNPTCPKTLSLTVPANLAADVLAVKTDWAAGATWRALCDAGTVQEHKSPQDSRPQLIRREREVCDRCGAVLPFLQQCGLREREGFSQANARCKACGRIAHIRQY
jgi:hypothetical protein